MNEQLLIDDLRHEVKDSTPAEITQLCMSSLHFAEVAHEAQSSTLLSLAMKQARVWGRLAWESDRP